VIAQNTRSAQRVTEAYLSANMSGHHQERIAIVGLGAIGGSLALALRHRTQLVAWSSDATDRASARAAGVPVPSDEEAAWVAEMADATIIVAAVPLDQLAGLVRMVLPRLPDETLLLHTASLQGRRALGLSDDEFRRVLGTHPVAGSERSGFAAADAGIFRGATVHAEARAAAADRERIETLWRETGVARIAWGDAAEHDELMSWVSHLPQLTATALAAVLAERGVTRGDIGRGAWDTTRLASSDPGMWTPILRNAPSETVAALRRLTRALNALGDALERHDSDVIEGSWHQARAWRSNVESSV
jgi:prephenate dehydrogenase